MRMLRIYGALFAQMLKVRLSYRGDFIADLLATALGGLTSFLFVWLFFVPVEDLAGWKRDEILFIVGLSMMSYGLFATVSWNLFEFGDRYIIDGRFDRVLLRPISTWAQILFDQFRIPVLSETAIGAGVVAYYGERMGLVFSPLEWGFVALTVLCGTAIYVFVFSILASIAFHFEDRVGVAPPVFNLIPFGRWPQEIFPWPVRALLRWLIPFGFIAYYPATALLDRSNWSGFALLAPVVTIAFGFLTGFAWRLGVRKYESVGA